MADEQEPIQVRLNCKGYFGFGGSWAQAEGYNPPDGSLYCNMCPESHECWELHKKRSAKLLPGLVSFFEEKAKEIQGAELMKWWIEEMKDKDGKAPPDPYSAVMLSNMESAMYLAIGQIPREFPWPAIKLPLEPVE